MGFPAVGGGAAILPGGAHKAARSIGPCFACGEFGHLKSTCSKAVTGSAKYPLNSQGINNLLSSGDDDPGELQYA